MKKQSQNSAMGTTNTNLLLNQASTGSGCASIYGETNQ
jgi:hypothetical protein